MNPAVKALLQMSSWLVGPLGDVVNSPVENQYSDEFSETFA